MVESADFNDPASSHPGLQPLRRGAQTDRPDDGHFRRIARRPAGPRLPDLHVCNHVTLRLEEAAKKRKAVWVLDRPNPIGRPVEGLTLRPGAESFVGAVPCQCGMA